LVASPLFCTQHDGMDATSMIFLPLASVITAVAGVTLMEATAAPVPPYSVSMVTDAAPAAFRSVTSHLVVNAPS
jgi:hypothetical protein